MRTSLRMQAIQLVLFWPNTSHYLFKIWHAWPPQKAMLGTVNLLDQPKIKFIRLRLKNNFTRIRSPRVTRMLISMDSFIPSHAACKVEWKDLHFNMFSELCLTNLSQINHMPHLFCEFSWVWNELLQNGH